MKPTEFVKTFIQFEGPHVLRGEFGGVRYYSSRNVLHREGDLPAVVSDNGSQHWYKNGQRHRDGDQPAVIWANGNKEWFINGLMHRDGNKPAIEHADGTKLYYYKGTPVRRQEVYQQ